MAEGSKRFSFGLDRFSGLYLWALFILIFGIWQPSLFLTQNTLHVVADSQAISGMLALAVLVPLAAGVYDLSVGATINLSAIIVSVLQTSLGFPIWLAIVVVIAISILVGLVNGFIVVKLRVNSFIATLGTTSVIGAVQIIVSPSQPIPPVSSAWSHLAGTSIFGFQIVVVYLLVMAIIVWWALDHTPPGRYLHAIGGNSEAARLSGVRVSKYVWTSLVISAVISGIAGVLFCSLSGPSLTFGAGLLLPAFAAAFLGSTQLRPGRFNVWGTMIAIYVLATGVQGLELATSQQWIGDMFNGVALVGAVAFAVWRQQHPTISRSPADPQESVDRKSGSGGSSGPSAGDEEPALVARD